MKIRNWVGLAIAATGLAGCSGFWNASSPTSTGTGSTTLTSGDIYVLNAARNEMVGLYVNAGKLTALPGSPYPLSAAPIAITVAPNNAFLYVSTLGGILVYTINASTGQLTPGNSTQAITADAATAMQVDPTNSWLIEGGGVNPGLYAVKINSATGLLAVQGEGQIAATLAATTVNQVAISPDGTYVLVANGTGGTATIPFNAANNSPFGKVGSFAPATTGGAALSVAFDPGITGSTTPRLFYIGETVATTGSNTGGLRAFNFSDLKEISGSPFAIGGLAPYSILPFSSGDYVYVASRQTASGATGVIAGFAVTTTGSAYTLTALGSSFTAGTNPQGLVEDSTKSFVFAVDFGGNPDLVGYTISATNAGYLSAVLSNATGTDPVQAGAIGALH